MEEQALVDSLWECTGPDAAPPVAWSAVGRPGGLASAYPVGELAVACQVNALRAASRWWSAGGAAPAVSLDRGHASAAFRLEAHIAPRGWTLPPAWDPVAGDYRCADGWLRLHTNYPWHRAAAVAVLRCDETREAFAEAVACWPGEALEEAVIARGGCAAQLRSPEAWAQHPAGRAVAGQPLVGFAGRREPRAPRGGSAPLEGVRVVDLTRVIAGPVCTRFLASMGAEVTRVDPPGFEEVAALLPETTRGKRRVALDLRSGAGREAMRRLLGEADVLVHGLRPGALEALGLGRGALDAIRPGLLDASICAYGSTGPWSMRRGFDSLVQMSSGIAWVPGDEKPRPLPAQALDHGAGYLLAAAVCRALDRPVASIRVSLARVAVELEARRGTGDPAMPPLGPEQAAETGFTDEVETGWGPARMLRPVGRVGDFEARLDLAPGPLG